VSWRLRFICPSNGSSRPSDSMSRARSAAATSLPCAVTVRRSSWWGSLSSASISTSCCRAWIARSHPTRSGWRCDSRSVAAGESRIPARGGSATSRIRTAWRLGVWSCGSTGRAGPWRPRRDSRRRSRLVEEHRRRQGDPALGGGSRSPIMTAYRQQALACAAALSAGPRRPPRHQAGDTRCAKDPIAECLWMVRARRARPL